MPDDALNIWREKLEFLQRELAVSADPSLKFQLEQQIKKAQARVTELESPSIPPPDERHSTFDVFLSHNSSDKSAIRKIGLALKKRGLTVWLDEWELVPGRPWQDALEDIIRTAKSAAVFVGSNGLGPWEEPEMRACLSEFVDRSLPVIPVLLPDAPRSPKLPLFLRQFTWVDLRRGISNEGMDRLVWGITGSKASKMPRVNRNSLRELDAVQSKESEIDSHLLSLPELYSVPNYVQGHTFMGREDELREIDTWAQGKLSILLLDAIGGNGKSALAWHWVNQHARKTIPDLAGALWWSFYEASPSMKLFVEKALAYVMQEHPSRFSRSSYRDNILTLQSELRKRPYLIVLDGFERLLWAYHRIDKSHIHDDEVDESQRSCIYDDDEQFLKQFVVSNPSKTIVTSRLVPTALEVYAGKLLTGVKRIKVEGLKPEDALSIIRDLGVLGDKRRLITFCNQFGHHPLLLRIVCGAVANYHSAPGDFNKWRVDKGTSGGGQLKLVDLELKQRRTHILAYAYDRLDAKYQIFLSRVAVLSSAVDYDTIKVLSPMHHQFSRNIS